MLFFDVSVVSLILLKTESLMFSEVVVFDDSCSEFTDSEVLMVVVLLVVIVRTKTSSRVFT